MPAKAFAQKTQLNTADFAELIRILIMSINYLQFSNHKLLYMACIIYFYLFQKKATAKQQPQKKPIITAVFCIKNSVIIYVKQEFIRRC